MQSIERLRVVVADDHPSIRENLRYLLSAEPDLEVVGVARNGIEALHMSLELRPDVVVLDQEMPVLDGSEVAARLWQAASGVRIVLYTLDDDADWTAPGGAAVVKKGAPMEDLLSAIRHAGVAMRAPTPAPSGAPRVLIVEDDDATRQALTEYLSGEGFSVEFALDGAHALRVASAGPPDIIVLDLGLPVLDGAGFAEQWRLHSGADRVPIVAVSGLPQGEAVAKGMGVAAYQRKPLDFEALAGLLRKTMGARPPAAG